MTAPTSRSIKSAVRVQADSVHADVRFGPDHNALQRSLAKRGPGSSTA